MRGISIKILAGYDYYDHKHGIEKTCWEMRRIRCRGTDDHSYTDSTGDSDGLRDRLRTHLLSLWRVMTPSQDPV